MNFVYSSLQVCTGVHCSFQGFIIHQLSLRISSVFCNEHRYWKTTRQRLLGSLVRIESICACQCFDWALIAFAFQLFGRICRLWRSGCWIIRWLSRQVFPPTIYWKSIQRVAKQRWNLSRQKPADFSGWCRRRSANSRVGLFSVTLEMNLLYAMWMASSRWLEWSHPSPMYDFRDSYIRRKLLVLLLVWMRIAMAWKMGSGWCFMKFVAWRSWTINNRVKLKFLVFLWGRRGIWSSGPYTFSIGDASAYSPYVSGGIFTQFKMPKTINFVRLLLSAHFIFSFHWLKHSINRISSSPTLQNPIDRRIFIWGSVPSMNIPKPKAVYRALEMRRTRLIFFHMSTRSMLSGSWWKLWMKNCWKNFAIKLVEIWLRCVRWLEASSPKKCWRWRVFADFIYGFRLAAVNSTHYFNSSTLTRWSLCRPHCPRKVIVKWFWMCFSDALVCV